MNPTAIFALKSENKAEKWSNLPTGWTALRSEDTSTLAQAELELRIDTPRFGVHYMRETTATDGALISALKGEPLAWQPASNTTDVTILSRHTPTRIVSCSVFNTVATALHQLGTFH